MADTQTKYWMTPSGQTIKVERDPSLPSEELDQVEQGIRDSWVSQRDNPNQVKTPPPIAPMSAPTGGGTSTPGGLEASYPNLAGPIQQAREAGASDEEIHGHIRGLMQSAFKRGKSLDQVNAWAGNIGPTTGQKIATTPIAGGIAKGIENLPSAAWGMAKGIGQAAITPPKEGLWSFTPSHFTDVGKGFVSGLTGGIYDPNRPSEIDVNKPIAPGNVAGIYQPGPSDEERARQELGKLGGFMAPFHYGSKAIGAVTKLPGAASRIVTGAGLGAAEPAWQGRSAEEISEGATTGAGLAAAYEMLPSFRRRPPPDQRPGTSDQVPPPPPGGPGAPPPGPPGAKIPSAADIRARGPRGKQPPEPPPPPGGGGPEPPPPGGPSGPAPQPRTPPPEGGGPKPRTPPTPEEQAEIDHLDWLQGGPKPGPQPGGAGDTIGTGAPPQPKAPPVPDRTTGRVKDILARQARGEQISPEDQGFIDAIMAGGPKPGTGPGGMSQDLADFLGVTGEQRGYTRAGQARANLDAKIAEEARAREAQFEATRLPPSLRGAKPRYTYGSSPVELTFLNDIEKAAYIVAQKTGSKANAAYLDWLQKTTGMNRQQAEVYGNEIKDFIKDRAKAGDRDVIVPSRYAGSSRAGRAAPEPTLEQRLKQEDIERQQAGLIKDLRDTLANPNASEMAKSEARAELGRMGVPEAITQATGGMGIQFFDERTGKVTTNIPPAPKEPSPAAIQNRAIAMFAREMNKRAPTANDLKSAKIVWDKLPDAEKQNYLARARKGKVKVEDEQTRILEEGAASQQPQGIPPGPMKPEDIAMQGRAFTPQGPERTVEPVRPDQPDYSKVPADQLNNMIHARALDVLRNAPPGRIMTMEEARIQVMEQMGIPLVQKPAAGETKAPVPETPAPIAETAESPGFDENKIEMAVVLDDGTIITGPKERGHKGIIETLMPDQQRRIVASGFTHPDLNEGASVFSDLTAMRDAYNKQAGVIATKPPEAAPDIAMTKTAEGMVEKPAGDRIDRLTKYIDQATELYDLSRPTPATKAEKMAAMKAVEEAAKGITPENIGAIEFTQPGNRYRGSILHKSTKYPGSYQVTDFDERGFVGDREYKAKELVKAISDAAGGKVRTQGQIDKLAGRPEFQKGNEVTRVVGLGNELSVMGDVKGMQGVHDAYARGGWEAASKYFDDRMNVIQGKTAERVLEKPVPSKNVSPEEQAAAEQMRGELGQPPIKRGRGRPPGSKNKPKSGKVADEDLGLPAFLKREVGFLPLEELTKRSSHLPKQNPGLWTRRAVAEKKGGGVRLPSLEEAAERAHAAGYIAEPTRQALLDALEVKGAGQKRLMTPDAIEKQVKAEEGARMQADVDYAAEAKIKALEGTKETLEFGGKIYEGAEREGGDKLRLKDEPDIVLDKSEDILAVERAATDKGFPWEAQKPTNEELAARVEKTLSIEPSDAPLENRFGVTEEELDTQRLARVKASNIKMGGKKGAIDAALANPSVQEAIAADRKFGALRGHLPTVEQSIRDNPPLRVEFENGYIIGTVKDAMSYGEKNLDRFGKPTGEIKPLGPDDVYDLHRITYGFNEEAPNRQRFEAKMRDKELGKKQADLLEEPKPKGREKIGKNLKGEDLYVTPGGTVVKGEREAGLRKISADVARQSENATLERLGYTPEQIEQLSPEVRTQIAERHRAAAEETAKNFEEAQAGVPLEEREAAPAEPSEYVKDLNERFKGRRATKEDFDYIDERIKKYEDAIAHYKDVPGTEDYYKQLQKQLESAKRARANMERSIEVEQPFEPYQTPENRAFKQAAAKYSEATKAYRARKIGDEEFLKAREEFERAKAVVDRQLEAAEQKPRMEKLSTGEEQGVFGETPDRELGAQPPRRAPVAQKTEPTELENAGKPPPGEQQSLLTGPRYEATAAGMKKGMFKVFDTQTGETMRVVNTMETAKQIADQLNKAGGGKEGGGGTQLFAGIPLPEIIRFANQKLIEPLGRMRTAMRSIYSPRRVNERAGLAQRLLTQRTGRIEEFQRYIHEQFKYMRAVMGEMPLSETRDFSHRFELGQPQRTPLLQRIADALRAALDVNRDELAIRTTPSGRPLLRHFIDDYLPHQFTNPAIARQVMAAIEGRRSAGKNLGGPKYFLKQRTWLGTMKEIIESPEGQAAGLTEKYVNPVEAVERLLFDSKRLIEGHDLLYDRLLVSHGGEPPLVRRISDPRTVPGGWSQIEGFKPTTRPVMDRLQPDAPAVYIPTGRFYAPDPVARIFNNYTRPGLLSGDRAYVRPLQWLREATGIANVLNLGASGFHAMTTMQNAMAAEFGRGVMAFREGAPLSEVAKRFGMAATYAGPIIRDVRLGGRLREIANDPHMAESYPEVSRLINQYVDSGGRIDNSRPFISRYLQDWAKTMEDRSILQGGNATVARAMRYASTLGTEFIMDRIVSPAKIASFAQRFQDFLTRNPGLSETELLKKSNEIMDQIDDAYGLVNYDRWGVDRHIRDTGFLALRAVGWTMGNLKILGGGIEDLARGKITERSSRFLGDLAAVAMTGTLINLALAHKLPSVSITSPMQSIYNLFNPEDGGVNPDGTPSRMGYAGIQRDWGHLLFNVAKPMMQGDPMGALQGMSKFATGKLSPILGLAPKYATGKDYFGRPMVDQTKGFGGQALDFAKSLGKEALPFSISNMMEEHKRGVDRPWWQGGWIGMTPPMTRRATESKFERLLNDRMPHFAPGSQAGQEHTEFKSQLYEKLAKGENVQDLLRSGKVTMTDVKQGMQRLQMQRQPQGQLKYSLSRPGVSFDMIAELAPTANDDEAKLVLDSLNAKYMSLLSRGAANKEQSKRYKEARETLNKKIFSTEAARLRQPPAAPMLQPPAGEL